MPNSATKNCGQLGSSSATRSPGRTPSVTSAAAQALLSDSSVPYDIDVPLKSSAGFSAVVAREIREVVDEGLVGIRRERVVLKTSGES